MIKAIVKYVCESKLILISYDDDGDTTNSNHNNIILIIINE
jgi:hypothetical protein